MTKPAAPRKATAKARRVHRVHSLRPSPAALANPEPPSFLEVTPSLAVRDVTRSLEFYQRLGFCVAAHLPPLGPPEWLRLERDRVAILVWNEVIASPEVLTAISQGRGAGSVVRIAVADVDTLARELEDNGVFLRRPPQTMPEGVRELIVIDPDGFIIEFVSRVPGRGDPAGSVP